MNTALVLLSVLLFLGGLGLILYAVLSTWLFERGWRGYGEGDDGQETDRTP